MKRRHKVFIWMVVGFMTFSAVALTLLVFISPTAEEESVMSDFETSVTTGANYLPDSDVIELEVTELEAGQGQRGATLNDVLRVHYTGWLATDGTVFDSSVTRGEPAVFPLSGVITGWQQGIVDMKVGAKRRLVIPSELGYGQAGSPPSIPPNADLVFEVELLEFVD